MLSNPRIWFHLRDWYGSILVISPKKIKERMGHGPGLYSVKAPG